MKTKPTNQLALVNYTQSWRLKALGFNLPCHHFYDEKKKLHYDFDSVNVALHCNEFVGEYSAPPVELVIQWIRDEKKMDCYVQIADCWRNNRARWVGVLLFADGGFSDMKTEVFETFPEASSAMLDKALSAMEGRCDLDIEID